MCVFFVDGVCVWMWMKGKLSAENSAAAPLFISEFVLLVHWFFPCLQNSVALQVLKLFNPPNPTHSDTLTCAPPSVMLCPSLLFLVVTLHTKCTLSYFVIRLFVSSLFSWCMVSQDNHLSHLGGIFAHMLWMRRPVLKLWDTLWLILIFFQLSVGSASNSVSLSFALSASLSSPVIAALLRQMNHTDCDRVFLGQFSSHAFAVA